MAQRVVTQLVSDLSGVELAEGEGVSIDFSVGGTSYRIDLTEAEAAAFETALAPYVEHGTRVGRRRTIGNFKKNTVPAPVAAATTDLNDVRAWARSHGFEVADRGRIKAEVLAVYAAAH